LTEKNGGKPVQLACMQGTTHRAVNSSSRAPSHSNTHTALKPSLTTQQQQAIEQKICEQRQQPAIYIAMTKKIGYSIPIINYTAAVPLPPVLALPSVPLSLL
jgi:hypothetical protein